MLDLSMVQSYDLILFSGQGFISKVIQLGSGSKWSHVALALVDQFDSGEKYCYESTTLSDLPDVTTGAKVKGVQLVNLRQRIEYYEGDVALRLLEGPRLGSQKDKAREFVREFAGRPYEQNQIELMRAALDMFEFQKNQPDTSSVFCSEMNVLLLRYLKIMEENPDKPENEFTPADLANDTLELKDSYRYADNLILLKGEL